MRAARRSFSWRLFSNLSLLGPELRLRLGLESGVSYFAEKNILNSAIVYSGVELVLLRAT